MIAYKFLAAGRTGPFTGYVWPERQWVDAPSSREGAGVHACRIADLPFWIDHELWQIELAGPVVERETEVETSPCSRWATRVSAPMRSRGPSRCKRLA
ncbi:MAG: hypothetical protein E6J62_16375 [Deltaproteobacteria bacterium]|nr:MAG: hypothetical protein E6J62_16375 [Deltaproteobacteria bacterium]